MTRVDFYQLQKWPLEKAISSLLEKIYSTECRAVLLVGSSARAEALTVLLWTYTSDSWLPHGSVADGYAVSQPIWITTTDENPNGADVLILTDSMDSTNKAAYRRCFDLFDGNDPDALAAARDRWQSCYSAGFNLFYWQQTGQGSWQQNKDLGKS